MTVLAVPFWLKAVLIALPFWPATECGVSLGVRLAENQLGDGVEPSYW